MRMLDPQEWGDGNTLLGAAILFRVRIDVLSTMNDTRIYTVAVHDSFGADYQPTDRICVAMLEDLHYFSTRPLLAPSAPPSSAVVEPCSPTSGSSTPLCTSDSDAMSDSSPRGTCPVCAESWGDGAKLIGCDGPHCECWIHLRCTPFRSILQASKSIYFCPNCSESITARVPDARRSLQAVTDSTGKPFSEWSKVQLLAACELLSANRHFDKTKARNVSQLQQALAYTVAASGDADALLALLGNTPKSSVSQSTASRKRNPISYARELEKQRNTFALRGKRARPEEEVAASPEDNNSTTERAEAAQVQPSERRPPGIIRNGDMHADPTHGPADEEWPCLDIGPLGGRDGTCCCSRCKSWKFSTEKTNCCVADPTQNDVPARLPSEVFLDIDEVKNHACHVPYNHVPYNYTAVPMLRRAHAESHVSPATGTWRRFDGFARPLL